MHNPLNDDLNLKILENISAGIGLEINLSEISRELKAHRNTVGNRIEEIFKHHIINPPVSPFFAIYMIYPLMVAVRADLPTDPKTLKWIIEDEHIFASFTSVEDEYNTLMFMFHKSILDYQLWREKIHETGQIPGRTRRAASTRSFISTNLMVKYEPNAGIDLIREDFNKNGKIRINDYKIDKLSMRIMELLMKGKGIRINESFLSERIGVHRKTIARRISMLERKYVILPPICRFPHFFVPPHYLLVYTMIEITKDKKDFITKIYRDPHVSIAFKTSEGKYNMVLFTIHRDIEDHFSWVTQFNEENPGLIGAAKYTYLSPKMALSINQQKVSLGIIKNLQNKKIKHENKWPPIKFAY